jgi:peptidoglycan-N-acetylglucosamine deacetylase
VNRGGALALSVGAVAGSYWGIGLAASRSGRRLMNGALVWRGPQDRPAVALTFDDGPHPLYTEQFVEALDGERATFFALGGAVRRWPEVARLVSESGHEVACHGDTHRRLTRLSPWSTVAEVRRGRDAVAEITGRAPRFFRPANGLFNLAAWLAVPGLGMRRALWSLSSRDWERDATPASIAGRVLGAVGPGAIVVMHDAGGWDDRPARTLQALPRIVEGLRARGLAMVTMSELTS